jgi:hypothetical protein
MKTEFTTQFLVLNWNTTFWQSFFSNFCVKRVQTFFLWVCKLGNAIVVVVVLLIVMVSMPVIEHITLHSCFDKHPKSLLLVKVYDFYMAFEIHFC